ncbi:MAG: glycosyltransferase family 9 protein [Phycisphaeraceae bacterium]|nr:glycosyltransferase family 9 protein [Phycisphaeraceae bacterium]
MSILIIRPSALGDVCRTVPVLASLRSAYPETRIDWLVQDSFADAISGHPALSGVVPFERGRLGKDLKSIRPASTIRFSAGCVLSSATVIDAQGLFRSGMLALATGARRRVGYANAQELGWLGYNTRHHHPVVNARGGSDATARRASGRGSIADMRLSTLPAEGVGANAADISRLRCSRRPAGGREAVASGAIRGTGGADARDGDGARCDRWREVRARAVRAAS